MWELFVLDQPQFDAEKHFDLAKEIIDSFRLRVNQSFKWSEIFSINAPTTPDCIVRSGDFLIDGHPRIAKLTYGYDLKLDIFTWRANLMKKPVDSIPHLYICYTSAGRPRRLIKSLIHSFYFEMGRFSIDTTTSEVLFVGRFKS